MSECVTQSHYLLGYISFSSFRGHTAEQAKSPLGPVLQGEHSTSCSISYQLGVQKLPPAVHETDRESESKEKDRLGGKAILKKTPQPFSFPISLFLFY